MVGGGPGYNPTLILKKCPLEGMWVGEGRGLVCMCVFACMRVCMYASVYVCVCVRVRGCGCVSG